MRRTLALVGALVIAGLFTIEFGPEILQQRNADYVEDEKTGRILAHLDLRLIRHEGAIRLHLGVQAQGGRVDPIYGFRGIAGANHITGRELQALMDDSALHIFSAAEGGRRVGGRVAAGKTGRVPERRVNAAGGFDFDARSALVYLLSVECRTVALAEGKSTVYLEARGVPRLRIDVDVRHRGRSRILEVVSLSGHDIVQ